MACVCCSQSSSGYVDDHYATHPPYGWSRSIPGTPGTYYGHGQAMSGYGAPGYYVPPGYGAPARYVINERMMAQPGAGFAQPFSSVASRNVQVNV